MRRAVYMLLAGALVWAAVPQSGGEIGSALPAWSPGMLDIHHISTGRGNSAFFVLPDGTTLLVDAGASGSGVPETDPHPDASPNTRRLDRAIHTTPSATAHYYARLRPDHALSSRPHGAGAGKLSDAADGSYKLTGITEVDSAVPIHTLVDRGWPDYSYPAPIKDATMANYRSFLEARRKKGMTVERFQPGARSQFRLRYNAAQFPFEIRNIIADGEVWTGTGEAKRALFPPLDAIPQADWPSENMCSAGIRLQYGSFRYFTGGDLPGTADPGFPAWHALEAAIAPLVGPVDIHVLNQHGSMGEESKSFLQALRSRVLIVPSWAPSHPAPDVLKRIMNSRFPPSPRYVFATDLREAARIVIGQRANQLAGPPGHIVVRVDPGGDHYRVYVLDNSNERDTVLAVL